MAEMRQMYVGMHADLQKHFGNVVRSKGFLWVASRHGICGEWNQAGPTCKIGPSHSWMCEDPDLLQGQDEEVRANVMKDFQEPYGDRRQELAIFGLGINQSELTARFDACVLTDAEMEMGPEGWRAFEDPFELDWSPNDESDSEDVLGAGAQIEGLD